MLSLRGEAERTDERHAVAVQAVGTDGRVMLHHVVERGKAAVVHVGAGTADLTQAGHTELAEIAVLGLDVARAGARERRATSSL